MTDLKIRTLTGILFIAVLIFAVMFSAFTFLGLFFCIALATLIEFYRITTTAVLSPQKITGTLICMLLFSYIAYVAQEEYKFSFSVDLSIIFKTPVIILTFIYLVFFAEIFRKKQQPFVNIGITVLGVFYIAIPYSLFCMMGLARISGIYSPELALGFLVLLWSNDTGAYLAGSKFGKHKLIERISPGKTWEGIFGGLALALIAATVAARYWTRLGLSEWLALAAVIAITATLGDLLASMLKRSLHLKDSGKFFPGHGGFLDRFDGLLGAAPFAYLFLYLLDRV